MLFPPAYGDEVLPRRAHARQELPAPARRLPPSAAGPPALVSHARTHAPALARIWRQYGHVAAQPGGPGGTQLRRHQGAAHAAAAAPLSTAAPALCGVHKLAVFPLHTLRCATLRPEPACCSRRLLRSASCARATRRPAAGVGLRRHRGADARRRAPGPLRGPGPGRSATRTAAAARRRCAPGRRTRHARRSQPAACAHAAFLQPRRRRRRLRRWSIVETRGGCGSTSQCGRAAAQRAVELLRRLVHRQIGQNERNGRRGL
jgi:hypothetical protein